MPQKPRSEQSQGADKSEKNQRPEQVQAAALALAAKHGWMDLTVGEIYAAAGFKTPLNAPKTVWPIVADILSTLDRNVSADVQDRLGGSWKDDLFELLMTRFDLMQPMRDAYSDIMPAALNRPCQSGRVLTRRLTQTMHDMIETTQVPVDGVRRHAAVVALSGIYLSLLEVWREDDTPDMAKTMAAVDQRLGWFADMLSMMSGRKLQQDA